LHKLLNDPRNINPKCIAEDLRRFQESSEIVGKLRKMGAGIEAYLVSENWDVDGKSGSLDDIVSLVHGSRALFIV
jgi:hypothetical protein